MVKLEIGKLYVCQHSMLLHPEKTTAESVARMGATKETTINTQYWAGRFTRGEGEQWIVISPKDVFMPIKIGRLINGAHLYMVLTGKTVGWISIVASLNIKKLAA